MGVREGGVWLQESESRQGVKGRRVGVSNAPSFGVPGSIRVRYVPTFETGWDDVDDGVS